jgi:hypothetical protein
VFASGKPYHGPLAYGGLKGYSRNRGRKAQRSRRTIGPDGLAVLAPVAHRPVPSRSSSGQGRLGLRELSLFDPPRRNPVMKAWSIVSLLFTAAILSTVPVSPQVTPHSVELSVDQAQAQATYGRYRRATRRAYRRAGYAVAPGYGATAAGYDHGGAVYGYGGAGYRVEPAGYGRWCNVYPSGFRWCWTDYASGYSGLTPQSLRRRRAGLNPQPLPP